jgi:hypothetical protein
VQDGGAQPHPHLLAHEFQNRLLTEVSSLHDEPSCRLEPAQGFIVPARSVSGGSRLRSLFAGRADGRVKGAKRTGLSGGSDDRVRAGADAGGAVPGQ